MHPQDLQINGLYNIIHPYNKTKCVIRYSGTAKFVKDLMCWFFYTENDVCVFLNESEVNSLTEVKTSVE
jgi:hypothetical protein